MRASHPGVEIIESSTNIGYAAGNNLGIKRALSRGADWVLLVNCDVVVADDLQSVLQEAARERPEAGVLACKVLFADDPTRIEYAGARFNAALGYSGRQTQFGEIDSSGASDPLREVDRATGAAMAVSARAIDSVGLLDESLFMYVEDTDWSLRMRAAGFAVVFVPAARVWHEGGTLVRDGRVSPTAFYYHARNMLAVVERHRPLPRGARGFRRSVVITVHLLQARRDRAAMKAVIDGWLDYRRGRMGARL